MSSATSGPQAARSTVRRTLVGAAIVAAVLLVVGAGYQRIGEAIDWRRHPPPGERVDANGFRLHIRCEGAGRPTVIVEAGLGGYSLDWETVQRVVAEDTRFCAYDRAGMGWSDYDARPPEPARVAANLRAALRSAGIEPPFVLVGHSIGGVYIRALDARFPGEVAGMVFVDSSHEGQRLRIPDEIRVTEDPLRAVFRLCRALAPIGVARALRLAEPYVPESFPRRATLIAHMNRTHYCTATQAARLLVINGLASQEAPASLGDMPLIVLSRGLADPGEPEDAPEVLERWEAAWLELQTELAALSSRGELRIVSGAGHNIHVDRPDAVIAAIRDVVAAARAAARPRGL